MGSRAAFTMACLAGSLVVMSAVTSCGARTGLLGETEEPFDAGSDVTSDDQLVGDELVPDQDLLPDRFFEDRVAPLPDASTDVDARDAFKDDVRDDLPGIDVAPLDAPIFNPCPDAAVTLIYVIGQTGTLYSYDPPTGTFATLGSISCPTSGSSSPFSMAVDREGIAYVEFADQTPTETLGANLYRVSTKTTSCTATPYDPAANGRVTFGMSFVANGADAGDGGETLFVALQPTQADGALANDSLAKIDSTSFDVSRVGEFSRNVQFAELTGTGDGRLFAFYSQGDPGVAPSTIGQIDPATAQVVAEDTLPLAQGRGWAFAYWGGAFYMFTAPSDHTVVTRFDPSDGTLIPQTWLDGDIIVGAGVSTCAPSQ